MNYTEEIKLIIIDNKSDKIEKKLIKKVLK